MSAAKKMALKELIKHMSKKRFQDKAVDPSSMMKNAMAEKGDDDEDDMAPPPTPPGQDEAAGDEFDDYRKGFMRGGQAKPAGHTLSIMIGQPTTEAKAGNPFKKGGKKRG